MPAYNTSLLPPTVPGHEALNSFKRATQSGDLNRPGLASLSEAEQSGLSANTSNPFARNIEDQDLWDGYFAQLLADGWQGRDIFGKSRNELLILTWSIPQTDFD